MNTILYGTVNNGDNVWNNYNGFKENENNDQF